MAGREVGSVEWEGDYIKERLSQWVLVSSRPLHLARWDFVYTHTHTTINGYNNATYSHIFLCTLL